MLVPCRKGPKDRFDESADCRTQARLQHIVAQGGRKVSLKDNKAFGPGIALCPEGGQQIARRFVRHVTGCPQLKQPRWRRTAEEPFLERADDLDECREIAIERGQRDVRHARTTRVCAGN